MKITERKVEVRRGFTMDFSEDEAEQLLAIVGGLTVHPTGPSIFTDGVYQSLLVGLYGEEDGLFHSWKYRLGKHPRSGVPCLVREDNDEG